ncbi:protein phosphatase 2C domain-containing protein [Actinomadura miaoliensis]|uniref:PPM-type phosphatase domain-containing protein n=1 Tax=Actinomadura miaoliensis TaxID=430685 RepID=A0ABP7X537_9ACTN
MTTYADGQAGSGAGDVTACARCGEPLAEDDRFCEACGAPSPAYAAASQAPAVAVPQARYPVQVRPDEPSVSVARRARRTPEGPSCGDCGATAISEDGFCEECGLRQPSGREHVEIELAAACHPEGRPAPAQAAGVSDRGLRRARNEDALAMISLPEAVCAVVCDGVASVPGSEEAARLAAETGVAVLARALSAGVAPVTATRTAIAASGRAVARLGEAGGGRPDDSPACTYVSAVVTPEEITVGWVGDSRAYWLAGPSGGSRPSALLTTDDSWAAHMVSRNAMSKAAAHADPRAHQLTGWLGATASPDPHDAAFRPGGPGVLLLCSDGLWNHLPEPGDLAAALADGPDASGDPLGAARLLVRAALDAGGHDNVTVAVVPFPSAASAAPPTPTAPTREQS